MLLDVEQTLNNRPLFYGECCLMESKLSTLQTTILCRVLLDVGQTLNNQTTILCRVLLDVEQTLNTRSLSYVECC